MHSVNVCAEGGVPKLPVRSAMLGFEGVEGDFNRFRAERRSGDPARAVCIYSLEVIRALQKEGHPIEVGTTGENLTFEGLDWSALKVGMVLEVGEASLEITEPCAPCNKIEESFTGRKFSRIDHYLEDGWSRWLAKVIGEGVVSPGDEVFGRNLGEA